MKLGIEPYEDIRGKCHMNVHTLKTGPTRYGSVHHLPNLECPVEFISILHPAQSLNHRDLPVLQLSYLCRGKLVSYILWFSIEYFNRVITLSFHYPSCLVLSNQQSSLQTPNSPQATYTHIHSLANLTSQRYYSTLESMAIAPCQSDCRQGLSFRQTVDMPLNSWLEFKIPHSYSSMTQYIGFT